MELQTKDKPWAGYNNKGLLRNLDETIELPFKKEYLTKDDVRFNLSKNKLVQDKK